MKKITVDAIGDICPVPVIKAKQAIKELGGAGEIEILVDYEVPVQNLTRLAKKNGYEISSKKLEEKKFQVNIVISEEKAKADFVEDKDCLVCAPRRKNIVVVVKSGVMGGGSDELGATLLKNFFFALTQQEEMPATILFYNGGAKMTAEGSALLEDLKTLEDAGVEILTCGACINFYGLSDKPPVGGVTNMYSIVETMLEADLIVEP